MSMSICNDEGPLICRTQAFSGDASAAVAHLLLLRTAVKADGASNSKLRPLIHLSVQKKVDSPLPKWCTVAAWKSAITARSQDAGALPLVLSFQTHRTRSAKPAFLRSVMPSPPTLSDDTQLAKQP